MNNLCRLIKDLNDLPNVSKSKLFLNLVEKRLNLCIINYNHELDIKVDEVINFTLRKDKNIKRIYKKL